MAWPPLVQRFHRHRSETTKAALRAFDQPILLLLGGRDKNLPWGELAELIHQKVEKVVLFLGS